MSEHNTQTQSSGNGSGEEPRIGVFICHCGGNISDVVDVKRVAEAIGRLPHVVFSTTHMFICSDPGQALIEHPDPDMMFFTGSTDIGRRVYMKAAERLKPVVMELGGKDPAIVTKNADLDRAAHAIAWGAFTNCGQTCIGMEVALVERPGHDPGQAGGPERRAGRVRHPVPVRLGPGRRLRLDL